MQNLRATPAELLKLGVCRTGRYRNLRVQVGYTDDRRPLVMVSNRTAAAAYRLQPGWFERFHQHLEDGLFG